MPHDEVAPSGTTAPKPSGGTGTVPAVPEALRKLIDSAPAFVRRLPPGWTPDDLSNLWEEWNMYAPHEVPERRPDPAEAAIIDLQREFIRNVGDDFASGTVFLQQQPAGAAASETGSPALAVSSITANGRKLALPLSVDDAAWLYESLGNPANLESGKSCAVGAASTSCQLSGPLATFDFAEARSLVHQRLCPELTDFTAEPTTLQVLRRGDARSKCRDVPATDDQVGSIHVHLPLAKDLDVAQLRANHTLFDLCHDPDREPGTYNSGEERFYVGRAYTETNECMTNFEELENMLDLGWDRPRAGEVLEMRVALGEYTKDELAVRASGGVPLRYVAWHCEVKHELMPVTEEYHVLLSFRVRKMEPAPRYRIPRLLEIQSAAAYAMGLMAARPNPITMIPGFTHDPSWLRPYGIGVLLRHTYPQSSILEHATQPLQVLRGLDAVAYKALSGLFTTLLFPAVLFKSDCHCARWRVQEFPHRFVFASANGYQEIRHGIGQSLNVMDAVGPIAEAMPDIILNCLWAQIGNGRLIGGGMTYGDSLDCGTDWWYRTAVLVVTPEPSRWSRRRVLLQIKHKSADRPADGEPEIHPTSIPGLLYHWNIILTIGGFL